MRLRATLIALAVAVLGGLVTWTYLKRLEAEISGGSLVGVLVVAKTLEAGAVLTAEHLAERWIPQSYVETRAVRTGDKGRVVNLRLVTPVEAQQTLLWTDLAVTNDDRRDVSALVQPGMRAVAIHAEGKATSLVRPGDRVDLIGIFPQPGRAEHRSAVVIVQNALVIARGNATMPGGPMAEAADLTLSLSVPQAQLVAVASERGKLSVALRNPDDVRVQEGLADVSSTLLVEPESRPAAARAKTGPARLDAR